MGNQKIGYLVLISFLSGAIGAFIILLIAMSVFLANKPNIVESFQKDLDIYIERVLSRPGSRTLTPPSIGGPTEF